MQQEIKKQQEENNATTSRSNKVLETIELLKDGVDHYLRSDNYKEILKNISKFHNYSYNNSILIGLQKPNATYVASYDSWKKNFNRQVKKDEKGIKIIAPVKVTSQIEVDAKDKTTGEKILNEDGSIKKEIKEVTHTNFKVGYVFDISNTEQIKNKPVIDLELTHELKGNVDDYKNLLDAIKYASPVPISFEDFDGPSKGYFDRNSQIIVIKKSMDEAQQIKTAIHETAHALLHNKENYYSKEDRELQAESVAYVVSDYYGHDTSSYSFPYAASWAGDSKRIDGNLKQIKEASDIIISKMDEKLQQIEELSKDFDEKPTLNFYSEEEIEALLKSDERLVYIDTGSEEVVAKYDDLPDVIVALDKLFDHQVELTVLDFKHPDYENPLATTHGCFLNQCDPEVREDIIDRLNMLQTGEEKFKEFKLIDEGTLDKVMDKLSQDYENFNECTVKFDNGIYLYMQCDDIFGGYDYTTYKYDNLNQQEYKEIDGGLLENRFLTPEEAIQEIAKIQGIDSNVYKIYEENYLENLEEFKEKNEMNILDLASKIDDFFSENAKDLYRETLFIGQRNSEIFSDIRRAQGQKTINKLNEFINNSADKSLIEEAKSLIEKVNYYQETHKDELELNQKHTLKLR